MTIQTLSESLPIKRDERVDLRRPRLVLCGDCGPSDMLEDRCQWCGGPASPVIRKRQVTKGDAA